MRTQSGPWWTGIVAASLCVLLPSSGLRANAADKMADGLEAGHRAGREIQSRLGSQDLLRQNILNPATSSATPLQTLDGGTDFSGQLLFPSSQKFLEVFMQPGPNGDLATVMIGEDLNFDGAIDYSYQVPFPVSGVCGNGVISCAPGTWTDCRRYLWQADKAGRVSLQEDFHNRTGGCYCINSDCGSNLVWSNAKVVLQDLGGGIVGAIQRANPAFTISDVKFDNTTISYYGQDTSRTTGPDGQPSGPSPVPPSQAAYLSAPLEIRSATQGAVAAQSGDAHSLYNLVGGMSANRQQNFCQIRKEVLMEEKTIHDVITPLGGTGAVQYCGPDCIDVVLGRIGDNYWSGNCTIFEEDFRFYIHLPELIESATLIRAKWDDYMQIWIGGEKAWSGPNDNFPPETAGACELKTSWDWKPNKEVTGYFQKQGEVQTKIRVSVTGKGEGFAFIRVRLKGDMCVSSLTVLDGCDALASRPDCVLQEERVDGVYTYRNGNPTGLVPLPSTMEFSQGGCSGEFTQDWWEKQRAYLCDAHPYDFSDAKTRFGRIAESLSEDGSTAVYQDALKTAGGWMPTSESFDLMPLPAHDECEKACKTRRSRMDSQVVLSGHSEQFQTSTNSYDILYRTCIDDRCPAEPDEEVLKDCQCLNEFAEAASILQMLRLAGQDTLCSDGTPKTP